MHNLNFAYHAPHFTHGISATNHELLSTEQSTCPRLQFLDCVRFLRKHFSLRLLEELAAWLRLLGGSTCTRDRLNAHRRLLRANFGRRLLEELPTLLCLLACRARAEQPIGRAPLMLSSACFCAALRLLRSCSVSLVATRARAAAWIRMAPSCFCSARFCSARTACHLACNVLVASERRSRVAAASSQLRLGELDRVLSEALGVMDSGAGIGAGVGVVVLRAGIVVVALGAGVRAKGEAPIHLGH